MHTGATRVAPLDVEKDLLNEVEVLLLRPIGDRQPRAPVPLSMRERILRPRDKMQLRCDLVVEARGGCAWAPEYFLYPYSLPFYTPPPSPPHSDESSHTVIYTARPHCQLYDTKFAESERFA